MPGEKISAVTLYLKNILEESHGWYKVFRKKGKPVVADGTEGKNRHHPRTAKRTVGLQ